MYVIIQSDLLTDLVGYRLDGTKSGEWLFNEVEHRVKREECHDGICCIPIEEFPAYDTPEDSLENLP